MKTCTRILAAVLLTGGMFACKKSLEPTSPAGPGNTTPGDSTNNNSAKIGDSTNGVVAYPTQPMTNCTGGPDYGDSILFPQPNGAADYIVKPINHPDSGRYFSWPDGLVLDMNSGAINVTKSETGLRYNIGWVKKGTRDTCLQTLILGGASYEDSLYILADNQRYAAPYFNADPSLTSVCGSGGPGGHSCAFDLTDQTGKHQIKMDKHTGIIDLKNTLTRAFGIIPINGSSITYTMLYTLNDKSNMAKQSITMKLMYFDKKSNIPTDLLASVTDKLNKILGGALLINVGGSAQQGLYSNPRPPIIIVTRSAL